MSYVNIDSALGHVKIRTTQNVLWEYESMYNQKCQEVLTIMSSENRYNPKCHLRIYTTQNIIWEYVQPPKMSYENMYNPKCHMTDNMYNHKCYLRICTTQNVIWEYVKPKMSYDNIIDLIWLFGV